MHIREEKKEDKIRMGGRLCDDFTRTRTDDNTN